MVPASLFETINWPPDNWLQVVWEKSKRRRSHSGLEKTWDALHVYLPNLDVNLLCRGLSAFVGVYLLL